MADVFFIFVEKKAGRSIVVKAVTIFKCLGYALIFPVLQWKGRTGESGISFEANFVYYRTENVIRGSLNYYFVFGGSMSTNIPRLCTTFPVLYLMMQLETSVSSSILIWIFGFQTISLWVPSNFHCCHSMHNPSPTCQLI